VVFLLAAVAGAVFGAGDQYLGSLSALPWAAPSSLLSAPWLLLPFMFGWTQLRPRRAVLAGLVVTLSALAGFFVAAGLVHRRATAQGPGEATPPIPGT
jgi:hypothetical protein